MKKLFLIIGLCLGINCLHAQHYIEKYDSESSFKFFNYGFNSKSVLTKAKVPHEYVLVININPPIGIAKLMVNSIAKNYATSMSDSTITWEDVTDNIDEFQIAGGDLWVCNDPWGAYVDGYWSGIGAQDLYFMRDHLKRLNALDLTRTVIQKDGISEKFVFPDYALAGCTSIAEVKIPRTTTKIGKSAFKNCSRLLCVNGSCYMPSKIRTIKYYYKDFKDKELDLSVLHEVDLSGINEENEIIDKAFSKLVEIGDSAFFGTRIERVQLPKSIKNIGKDVFGDCNIKEVIFHGDENVMIGVNAFGEFEKDSIIVYVNEEKLVRFRKKFGNRFKAIRQIGYISPNPIEITLENEQLIIVIKDDASETGYIIDSDGEKIDLKIGKNTVYLSNKKNYSIIVGDEHFKLKRYEF